MPMLQGSGHIYMRKIKNIETFKHHNGKSSNNMYSGMVWL